MENALGVGDAEFVGEGDVIDNDVGSVAEEAETFDLETAQGFLEALFEGAADGHGFADGLHLGGEGLVGSREFFKRETGDFGDDVVDGGLERSRGFAGDVVFEFVEGVTDGEFGGDLGDGEAGGFGSEGGTAADARVHLDDDHATGVGMDGELDVGTAGFDADLADAGEAGVAHDLIFAIGEGLDGGDGDGVAGVDAHGVEVLDGADDDAVVGAVTHDFHFEFFPAEEGFVNLNFADGREVDAAGDDGFEFFAVVGDAAAGAAEGEGGADDEGEGADFFSDGDGVVHFVRDAGFGHVEPDFEHGVFEKEAVFAFVDGFGVGTDHADVVFFEDTALKQGHGGVEGGLAAEGGEEGVGLFAFDDLLDDLGGDGFDVGAGGELRVGHDGGRVGVDQDDFVSFFAEGFAGLDAGVVEFTALSDDDGTGTDEKDLVEGWVFGHGQRGAGKMGVPSRIKMRVRKGESAEGEVKKA